MSALATYFVERDRLQAGLSTATIVIQTDENGGTMHAVKATLASGKNLAAIRFKGTELEYAKTEGNEMLIQEGKAFALTSDNLPEFIRLFSNKTISLHPVKLEQSETAPILPLATTKTAKNNTNTQKISSENEAAKSKINETNLQTKLF